MHREKKKKSVQCYTVRTDLDKELYNPPTDVQNITIFWTFSTTVHMSRCNGLKLANILKRKGSYIIKLNI